MYQPPSFDSADATLKHGYTAPTTPYTTILKSSSGLSIRPLGTETASFGEPSISNLTQYVHAAYLDTFAVGDVRRKSASPITTITPTTGEQAVTGTASIKTKYQFIRPNRALHIQFGNPELSFMVRTVTATGSDCASFGSGYATNKGDTQNAYMIGSDTFACARDKYNFDKRMRIYISSVYTQKVMVNGDDLSNISCPYMRDLRRFIRPDGNSDMFRQGIPKWILD